MQYLLKDLALPAKIGVYETEKGVEQTLIVSVRFEFDAQRAAQTDLLSDTVDYALIEQRLRKICLSQHFELLEKLHATILRQLNQEFPLIEKLEVMIEKTPFESGSIIIQ